MLSQRGFSDAATFDYIPSQATDSSVARARGLDLLHNPVYNKGMGHHHAERERLGLRGLLPPRVMDMDEQMTRVLDHYWNGLSYIDASQVESGGITQESTRKWNVLQALQDRNETLFYKVLIENFVEMAPIIYTPTVGWACINYSKLFRRTRGMYFTARDKGEMASMVWNWPRNEVDAIVVTDGSRILGLGDLGANGLGIPIGKLDLYVAAGGFHPQRILPCVIDVGTNNEELRNDPLYIGLKQPRLRGDEYYEVVDEFVRAVMGRWPKAVLQFEDFNTEHALPLLERYRHHHTMFNDDVQGTAAMALAGIYGAMTVLGKPPSAITEQKFVVVGAGSAGMGVISMIAQGMVDHGLSPEQAAANFWVLDNRGLITAQRPNLPPHVQRFARRDPGSTDGMSLVDTIKHAKPTALMGLSGAGRLFTPQALTLMGQLNDRPLIFPLSNPTLKMECTHEDAQKYCKGRAIFASGSPQPDVTFEGKVCAASQANNLYIFPGLALGAFLAQGNVVTDAMVMAAAKAIPEMITPEELEHGRTYPSMHDIRSISKHVAVATLKAAADEGKLLNEAALKAMAQGDQQLHAFVQANMFTPVYTSLVNGASK